MVTLSLVLSLFCGEPTAPSPGVGEADPYRECVLPAGPARPWEEVLAGLGPAIAGEALLSAQGLSAQGRVQVGASLSLKEAGALSRAQDEDALAVLALPGEHSPLLHP
jgi:hypothetical protein